MIVSLHCLYSRPLLLSSKAQAVSYDEHILTSSPSHSETISTVSSPPMMKNLVREEKGGEGGEERGGRGGEERGG